MTGSGKGRQRLHERNEAKVFRIPKLEDVPNQCTRIPHEKNRWQGLSSHMKGDFDFFTVKSTTDEQ